MFEVFGVNVMPVGTKLQVTQEILLPPRIRERVEVEPLSPNVLTNYCLAIRIQ